MENYLYGVKNSVATKADGAPPNFDEVKAEIDPLVDEGLKWFEENPKETAEVYKNKQKELTDKIMPLLMKLQGTQAGGGMPMGIPPEMAGMAEEAMKGMGKKEEEEEKEEDVNEVD